MSDLTITAGNVIAGANAVKVTGVAGGSVGTGQVVYRDPTSLKLLIADSDSATAGIRKGVGIALHPAVLDQPLTYITEGDLAMGAILTAGEFYVEGDTPGAIMPYADLESGDYPRLVGQAKSTTVLNVHFYGNDVVKS